MVRTPTSTSLRIGQSGMTTYKGLGSFDSYEGRWGAVMRVKAIRLAQLLYGPPKPIGCGCPRCTPTAIICFMCENTCDSPHIIEPVGGKPYALCSSCFRRYYNPD